MHPLTTIPPDSVPRLAWGKFRPEGDTIVMPLGVQGHHALLDGLHAGRLFGAVQSYFDEPDRYVP